DEDVLEPQPLDEREGLALGPGADREHGDDRPHAEDHPQHGERRAQLVDRQVVDCRPDCLAGGHGRALGGALRGSWGEAAPEAPFPGSGAASGARSGSARAITSPAWSPEAITTRPMPEAPRVTGTGVKPPPLRSSRR